MSKKVSLYQCQKYWVWDTETEKLEFVEDEIAERLSPHLLKKEDIVFGREGSCRRPSFGYEEQETGCKDQLHPVSVSTQPRFAAVRILRPFCCHITESG